MDSEPSFSSHSRSDDTTSDPKKPRTEVPKIDLAPKKVIATSRDKKFDQFGVSPIVSSNILTVENQNLQFRQQCTLLKDSPIEINSINLKFGDFVNLFSPDKVQYDEFAAFLQVVLNARSRKFNFTYMSDEEMLNKRKLSQNRLYSFDASQLKKIFPTSTLIIPSLGIAAPTVLKIGGVDYSLEYGTFTEKSGLLLNGTAIFPLPDDYAVQFAEELRTSRLYSFENQKKFVEKTDLCIYLTPDFKVSSFKNIYDPVLKSIVSKGLDFNDLANPAYVKVNMSKLNDLRIEDNKTLKDYKVDLDPHKIAELHPLRVKMSTPLPDFLVYAKKISQIKDLIRKKDPKNGDLQFYTYFQQIPKDLTHLIISKLLAKILMFNYTEGTFPDDYGYVAATNYENPMVASRLEGSKLLILEASGILSNTSVTQLKNDIPVFVSLSTFGLLNEGKKAWNDPTNPKEDRNNNLLKLLHELPMQSSIVMPILFPEQDNSYDNLLLEALSKTKYCRVISYPVPHENLMIIAKDFNTIVRIQENGKEDTYVLRERKHEDFTVEYYRMLYSYVQANNCRNIAAMFGLSGWFFRSFILSLPGTWDYRYLLNHPVRGKSPINININGLKLNDRSVVKNSIDDLASYCTATLHIDAMESEVNNSLIGRAVDDNDNE